MVVDVAFISLSKIIKDIEIVARTGGDIILLYKPQFEVGKENISKKWRSKKGYRHSENTWSFPKVLGNE